MLFTQVPENYIEPYKSLPEPRRTYAGMLAAMDEAIGQILSSLDETGRRKNALIFFSSDNGGPNPRRVTRNGSLRAGKGTLYEGGVRTVACVAWDGHIKSGSVVQTPMHVTDLYPTFLKLAGAKLEQKLPLDGVDILACLTDGKPSPRKEFLVNSTPTKGAIRIDDWKLVVNGNAPDPDDTEDTGNAATSQKPANKASVALFDLASDPSEKKDLADEKPTQLKQLLSRYEALAKEAVPPKNVKP